MLTFFVVLVVLILMGLMVGVGTVIRFIIQKLSILDQKLSSKAGLEGLTLADVAAVHSLVDAIPGLDQQAKFQLASDIWDRIKAAKLPSTPTPVPLVGTPAK